MTLSSYPLSSVPHAALIAAVVAAPAAAPEGWYRELSVAPQRVQAPRPDLRAFGVTQVVEVVVGGWQQPLDRARSYSPAARTQPEYAWRDTQFTQNTQDISKWQQPLQVAAARPSPRQGLVVNWISPEVADNSRTEWDWFRPLAVVPRVVPRYSQPDYTFLDVAFTQNTQDISRWQQRLAGAPPPNRPREGLVVNWRSTEQEDNTRTGWDWYRSLADAPPPVPLVKTQVTYTFLDTAFTQNTVAIDKWQQPLAGAPHPNRPREGLIANWRSTEQEDNTRTAWDWYLALAGAAQRPPVREGGAVWPPRFVQQTVEYVNGWQIALSEPTSRRSVSPTQPDYAFRSTQFTQNTVTIEKWQQPLSKPIDRIYISWTPVEYPLYQPVVVTTVEGWQVYSQVAIRRLPAPTVDLRPFGITFEAFTTFGWYQSLTIAVSRPPVWQGEFFVPFDTEQVPVVYESRAYGYVIG